MNRTCLAYWKFFCRIVCFDDERLFCSGGCHLFAEILNQKFGHPIYKMTSDNTNAGISHVFCGCDGFYLDVRGAFVKKDIDQIEARVRPISETTIRCLKREFRLKNGQGLIWITPLTLLAKLRARWRIKRLPNWYNGQNKMLRTPNEWKEGTQ